MSDFLDASVPLSQYTQAFGDTLYMVCVALFIGSVIGIPVGVLLAITRKDGLRENRIVYVVLNTVVNIVRSVPFIILMVAIMPFTRLVVHTSIGTNAAIVPPCRIRDSLYRTPYRKRHSRSGLRYLRGGGIFRCRND